ncbi:alkylphosphonate utilization protein [Gluconacetobacter azotocaptans]|uniref:Alkylphosphonate utilization protein n=1 Tax=Gluconacetobacter azotocaptans TaxID=142834 RepID=A0A7W4JQU9_9PROT|nr:zinc ribbon domain-containing protein YjdM [Gluconacetobacter azotocaptans]MBB2189249.1 alkylphosphonate utilization protein [Gluconacetobacter azotocaptans]GBQ32386.1 alkylphosphonate uptake protein PhnA [Gluconacetobacter azotocaptans DSM 13594]
MSTSAPACPQCTLEETHVEGANHVCEVCGYEWPADIAEAASAEDVVRDANGVILADGDTVVVIKDLKVKGSSTTLKVGTRIKNIRLRGGDHAVEAGSYMLKAEFLRKA